MNRFLLQMAGQPGSGKSTLAHVISKRIEAVVLDKDMIKANLLDSNVPESLAAPSAYEVLFAQADDLLKQGFSVILDSPSFSGGTRPDIPGRGRKLAEEQGAIYGWIECLCSDRVEHARRLNSRHRRSSQYEDAITIDYSMKSAEPTGIEILQLETSEGVEAVIERAMDYLARLRVKPL